eukprot:SAG31_NODE_17590_length_665_cov_1.008834_1_plen_109_part_00
MQLDPKHAPNGAEPGLAVTVPEATVYSFDVWLDRSVVEVYGDGGAQVLVGNTGILGEPMPQPPRLWAMGAANTSHEVRFEIVVADVRSTVFKSDEGPWNPPSPPNDTL